MDFQEPLYKGQLLQRISKVLADVRLESGETVTAFCSNTTKMTGLTLPKTEVQLSYSPSEIKHLHFTWETAFVNGTMVGVNMARHTDLIAEAIYNQTIYELGGYEKLQRSDAAGPYSFMNLQLIPFENSGYPICNVAIAPAYLKKQAELSFPDSVEVINHQVLKQLDYSLSQGNRSVLILLAQRIDCIGVRIDWAIDPTYSVELRNLYNKGLEIICCGCSVSEQGIWLTARLPFTF